MIRVVKNTFILVALFICATASVYAIDVDRRPRRKTEKKYTSPEEIKSSQDSVDIVANIDTTATTISGAKISFIFSPLTVVYT